MSSTEDSQNETIRKSISNFLDDKGDINDLGQKKNLIEKIKKENPTFKENSVKVAFSKFSKSESNKRGIEKVTAKSKKRFNENLSVKLKDNSGLTVTNPKVTDNKPKEEKPKTPIPISMCETTGNVCYSFIRMHDSDMEDLSPQEKKDIGEIIKYFADTYGGGEKFNAFMMLTGMFGIMINKKRKAKKLRKEKKNNSEDLQSAINQKQIEKPIVEKIVEDTKNCNKFCWKAEDRTDVMCNLFLGHTGACDHIE